MRWQRLVNPALVWRRGRPRGPQTVWGARSEPRNARRPLLAAECIAGRDFELELDERTLLRSLDRYRPGLPGSRLIGISDELGYDSATRLSSRCSGAVPHRPRTRAARRPSARCDVRRCRRRARGDTGSGLGARWQFISSSSWRAASPAIPSALRRPGAPLGVRGFVGVGKRLITAEHHQMLHRRPGPAPHAVPRVRSDRARVLVRRRASDSRPGLLEPWSAVASGPRRARGRRYRSIQGADHFADQAEALR